LYHSFADARAGDVQGRRSSTLVADARMCVKRQ
jgi:hypothetical protein